MALHAQVPDIGGRKDGEAVCTACVDVVADCVQWQGFRKFQRGLYSGIGERPVGSDANGATRPLSDWSTGRLRCQEDERGTVCQLNASPEQRIKSTSIWVRVAAGVVPHSDDPRCLVYQPMCGPPQGMRGVS